MISHESIWFALDRLADELGYSPSGLARKAGLDPTAFNKSKRLSPEGKPRWPSTESIAKVLSVTGQSMERFVTLVEHVDGTVTVTEQTIARRPTTPKPMPTPIPALPLSVLAHPSALDAYGNPTGNGWGSVDRDEFIPQSDALLAVELTDMQFAPVYRAGDVLMVQRDSQPRRGDRVLVVLNGGQGVTLGVFIRKTRDHVELSDLLGQQSAAIGIPHIKLFGRIIMVTQ